VRISLPKGGKLVRKFPPEGGKVVRIDNYVVVPALPGCFSQGRTIEEAERNARKAIALHVRSLRADGIDVPTEPADAYSVAVAA